MKSSKALLFRGPPGSGKSTAAQKFTPKYRVLEADQFFVDSEGNYKFDPAKLKDAHEWCLRSFKACLENGIPVVVANTFTRKWEIEPYLKLSPGALVFRFSGEFQNVHGVPEDKVQAMRNRMEDIPGEILVPVLEG